MSHAILPPPVSPLVAAGLRVLYQPPVCPDCASSDVITEDVETGDEVTETALICRACGAAWPVACVCEWRATVAEAAPAAGQR